MTRVELILRTRQLIAEGERLYAAPSLTALQTWLQLSDDLLATAWGTMDRYHLAWLMVGKPKGIVRGRAMTPDEEAAYVREVASQKNAALRMSLDAVERQGMPFRGETGGLGPGQGMGEMPATGSRPGSTDDDAPGAAPGRRAGTLERGRSDAPRASGAGVPEVHPARSRAAGPPGRGATGGGRPRRARRAARPASRTPPALTTTRRGAGGTRASSPAQRTRTAATAPASTIERSATGPYRSPT